MKQSQYRLAPQLPSGRYAELAATDAGKASLKTVRQGAAGSGRMKLGRCVFSERPKNSAPFSQGLGRLWELEKIIRARHNGAVPETDDADAYIRVAAFALNAHCRTVRADFEHALRGWCHRWAPWSLSRAGDVIRPILNDLVGRKYDMKADEVARLLHVKLGERDRLGLKLIGACDVTTRVRKAIAKSRKRERDKQRQADKRRLRGCECRATANSIAKLKPWEAEGISRRTWFRRRGTKASRVGIPMISDTSVPSASAPALQALRLGANLSNVAQAFRALSSLQSPIGADSVNEGAAQCGVNRRLVGMGGANA